jgi:hypothetical protein
LQDAGFLAFGLGFLTAADAGVDALRPPAAPAAVAPTASTRTIVTTMIRRAIPLPIAPLRIETTVQPLASGAG